LEDFKVAAQWGQLKVMTGMDSRSVNDPNHGTGEVPGRGMADKPAVLNLPLSGDGYNNFLAAFL
jgi:hypothetical protein